MPRGRKPKCPYCTSTDNVRKGVRRTITLGDRSLRHCKSCQRRFTIQRAARLGPPGYKAKTRRRL